MKKNAVICSCALLAFFCVFAGENRTAGQGKKAAQAKKAPVADAPLPQVDKEKIREHVKYLSSDELEGRGTGQRGGDVAADYIGKQFAAYGLKPAGDNGKTPLLNVLAGKPMFDVLSDDQMGFDLGGVFSLVNLQFKVKNDGLYCLPSCTTDQWKSMWNKMFFHYNTREQKYQGNRNLVIRTGDQYEPK